MSSITSTILSLILAMPTGIALEAPASVGPLLVAAQHGILPTVQKVPEHAWHSAKGDRVLVDTLNNQGYIFHTDGRYVQFPIVTGQRRFVWYIGRYYFGATPNWNWTAKSMHIKGDRVTFGPSGRFLRLYKDGTDRTAYGFHEHRDEEEMFALPDPKRFRSYGCIIVKTPIMDLLEETFEKNDNELPVISVHGIEELHVEVDKLAKST